MLLVYLKNKINHFIYILFIIFLFGMLSGIPFFLILSTLNMWLLEIGFNKTQIGFFSLATFPYSFKFLFGPYIDYLKIPFFSVYYGQRKSWLLLSQFLLIFFIICLSLSSRYNNFLYSIFLVFFIIFSSAIQDVIIEAYRIELLRIYKIKLSFGSTFFVLGYRIGMLFSGPFALYFSFYYNSWMLTYFIMSIFIFFGFLITLFFQDRIIYDNNFLNNFISFKFIYSYLFRLYDIRIALIFIVFFKIGDIVLNTMSMPFFLDLGFSKLEIIYIVKTFGMIIMIVGGIIGGIFLINNNIWKLFLICCFLQIFTVFLFFIQSIIGYDIYFLLFIVIIENLFSGMSQIAIVTYFSYLCCVEYTATCYACLSSFSSFIRVGFSFLSGVIADLLIWDYFYLFVLFSCMPCFIFLFFFRDHFINIFKK